MGNAVDLEDRREIGPQKVRDIASAPGEDLSVLDESADASRAQQAPRPRFGCGVCTVSDIAQRLAEQPASAARSAVQFDPELVDRAQAALHCLAEDRLNRLEPTQFEYVIGYRAGDRREWYACVCDGVWDALAAPNPQVSPMLRCGRRGHQDQHIAGLGHTAQTPRARPRAPADRGSWTAVKSAGSHAIGGCRGKGGEIDRWSQSLPAACATAVTDRRWADACPAPLRESRRVVARARRLPSATAEAAAPRQATPPVIGRTRAKPIDRDAPVQHPRRVVDIGPRSAQGQAVPSR